MEITREAGHINLGECDFDAHVSYSYGGYAPTLTLTFDSNQVDVTVHLTPEDARRLGVILMEASNAAERLHGEAKAESR